MQDLIMEQALCSPHTSVFVMLLFYTISFPLVFTPGIVASKQLLDRNILAPKFIPLFCFGLISLLGYLFFFIFYFDYTIAKTIGLIPLLSISALYFIGTYRKIIISVLSNKDIYIPFILMFVLGFLYLSIIYIGYVDEYKCAGKNLSFIVNRLFQENSSPDYLAQKLWIDNIFNGRSPWGIFVDPNHGKTLLSDRPPMLAGIVMIYYSWIPANLGFHFFMAMTTVLSLSWISAMWAILRTANLPLLRTALFIFALSQTYYFLFSTVYSWPKALSGTLFTGAFILLVLEPILTKKKLGNSAIILGSILGGLSIMTHNSTILLLIPLCLMLVTPKLFPGIRLTIVGFTIVGIILSPWVYIKSNNEYSMSNLSTYTLSTPAEDPMPDEFLNLSAYEAAKITYSKLTVKEIIKNKLYNLKSILYVPHSIQTVMDNEEIHVFSVVPSLQLFNIAWPIILICLFFKLIKRKDFINNLLIAYSPSINKTVILSSILSISALIIFAMINFRGGVNNIATSGIPILLFTCTGLLIFSLRIRFVMVFIILQSIYFFFIVFNKIFKDNLIILPEMIIIFIMSLIFLIGFIYKDCKIIDNDINREI
jgi:hypothetical protein